MGPGYEQPAAGDSPRTREPEQSPTWPRDDIYRLAEKAMYGQCIGRKQRASPVRSFTEALDGIA